MTLHVDTTRWWCPISNSDFICSWRWRSSKQSAKARPGADCGSEHQLFTAKFRLKSKKVGETTRPFRYGLNQIAYNYTVEVTNRSKKLDLIYRVPGELWTKVHNTVQEAVIKTIPKRKKCKSKPLWDTISHQSEWLQSKSLQIINAGEGVEKRVSLNLAIRSSWSEPQSSPGLVFAYCIELLHLWLQRI